MPDTMDAVVFVTSLTHPSPQSLNQHCRTMFSALVLVATSPNKDSARDCTDIMYFLDLSQTGVQKHSSVMSIMAVH